MFSKLGMVSPWFIPISPSFPVLNRCAQRRTINGRRCTTDVNSQTFVSSRVKKQAIYWFTTCQVSNSFIFIRNVMQNGTRFLVGGK